MLEPNDAQLIEELRRTAPDFTVTSWRSLGEGWMSRALLVNDAWVARFAKREEASSDFVKEASVLPLVAARVTLAVPRFAFTGKQRNGLGFVVYPALPGEPMEETLGELPLDRHERVAAQLAGFIGELQALPLAELVAAGMPSADLTEDVAEQYAGWRRLERELPRELYGWAARRFEEYLGTPAFHRAERRFLHADLSPNHWLFDHGRGELSGIIDFGDCELGDPDYEYLYLLEDAGERFTRRVLELGRVANVEERLRKLRLLVTFDHVEGVLASERYAMPELRPECLEALEVERTSNERGC